VSPDKGGTPVSFEEALRLILENATEGTQITRLPVAEVDGYVLAEDVHSPLNMPAFNKSAMDGFAFRHRDHTDGDSFQITTTVAAGDAPGGNIEAGECVRIMTGAPVPDDADTVIPVEDTSAMGGPADGPSAEGGEEVRFHSVPPRGANIAPLGQDVREGDVVLKAGHLLRAQEICVLAAMGRAEIPVYLGPTVAFAGTGEELVEPGGTLAPGQIYNSNAYNLWSQILHAKGRPHYLGILPDQVPQLREKISEGLSYDMLVLSGGVSMGRFDYIPQVFAELGVELYFQKLLVQPGRPTVFGRRDNTLVFGLPGNPISTLYAFDQYVAPAVRFFRRHPRPQATRLTGELTETITKKAGRLNLVPCNAEWSEGHYILAPLKTSGSADIFSIAGANALALIPAGVEEVSKGKMVSFRRLYE